METQTRSACQPSSGLHNALARQFILDTSRETGTQLPVLVSRLIQGSKRPIWSTGSARLFILRPGGNDGRGVFEGIWLAACEMWMGSVRVAHLERKPIAPEIRLSLDMRDTVLSSAAVPRQGLVTRMMRLGARCLG